MGHDNKLLPFHLPIVNVTYSKINQIIGAVIDVVFPRSHIPKIYDALVVKEVGLTLEVQQAMGDGMVRCIAMGSSDGLKRGLFVKNTNNVV